MKNKLKIGIVGYIIGAITMLPICGFADEIKEFIANKATFPVLINGEQFNSSNPILVVDGKTYLPTKETGDALGVDVKWNEEKSRVEITKEDDKVEEVISSFIPSSTVVSTPTPSVTPDKINIPQIVASTPIVKKYIPIFNILDIQNKSIKNNIEYITYKDIEWVNISGLASKYGYIDHLEGITYSINGEDIDLSIYGIRTKDDYIYVQLDKIKSYLK